jgi:hypothetical protein
MLKVYNGLVINGIKIIDSCKTSAIPQTKISYENQQVPINNLSASGRVCPAS